MTDEQTNSGISRRDVIRRGAIIGGVAWSAPIVQSLTSPAFAAGSEAAEGICDTYVFVKVNVPPGDYAGDLTFPIFENVDPTCGAPLDALPGVTLPGPVTTLTAWNNTTKTATGTIAGHGTITAQFGQDDDDVDFDFVTITAPDDCRIFASVSKWGNTCQPLVTNSVPLPQSEIFPEGGRAEGLSHVDLVLCCND